MKYTLEQIRDQEITSYRPIGIDGAFYVIRFEDNEEIFIYSGILDQNPEIVEDADIIPKEGWIHNDDCQCDDCIQEEEE